MSTQKQHLKLRENIQTRIDPNISTIEGIIKFILSKPREVIPARLKPKQFNQVGRPSIDAGQSGRIPES